MVQTTYEYDFGNVRAFCKNCEHIHLATELAYLRELKERPSTSGVSFGTEYDAEENDWACPHCGERMIRFKDLGPGYKSAVKFWLWSREMMDRQLGGPSPGGAAGELECSRAMVDKLVDLGVLERCEYNEDGHRVVMISSRSIEAAKEAKAIRGRWTDATVVQEVHRRLGKDSGGSDNEKA